MSNGSEIRTCGNCGAVVERDAITCDACSALLSAYEATEGSVSASVPTEVPSAFSIPAAPASVTQPPSQPAAMRPATQSPIADALKGIEDEQVTPGEDEDPLQPASPSTLAQEIEAELADARVTFDHGQATITAATDTAMETKMAPAEAAEPTATSATAVQTTSTPAEVRQTTPESATRTDTTRPTPLQALGMTTAAPERRPTPTPAPPTATGAAQTQPVTGAKGSDVVSLRVGVGIVVVLLLVLTLANGGGFRSIVLLASALIICWVLWWMAKSTSRRTTTMPRDKSTGKRRLP